MNIQEWIDSGKPFNSFILGDCMEGMKEMPDNFVDLAIVDPVYDLPESYLCPGSEESKGIKRNHVKAAKKLSKQKTVSTDYYNELCRVSKHQIIWGINYFSFSNMICGRIVWDKKNDCSSFSNCEIASSSFFKGVRIIRYLWNGMLQEDMKNKEKRIHPFQKPVNLYRSILRKYTNIEWKILDTHVGSGSSLIACEKENFEYIGFEICPDHYEDACKRIERERSQLRLF